LDGSEGTEIKQCSVYSLTEACQLPLVNHRHRSSANRLTSSESSSPRTMRHPHLSRSISRLFGEWLEKRVCAGLSRALAGPEIFVQAPYETAPLLLRPHQVK